MSVDHVNLSVNLLVNPPVNLLVSLLVKVLVSLLEIRQDYLQNSENRERIKVIFNESGNDTLDSIDFLSRRLKNMGDSWEWRPRFEDFDD